MGKRNTTRFAVGTPEEPYSGVWRFVVRKNDVYIGSSKESMGIYKLSLHPSGVWVLAATEQSGATFKNGNRRAKKWSRPLEHTVGITRGPSILVPHTSLGYLKYKENEQKKVHWFPPPEVGEVVEFSIYFIEPNTELKVTDDHTLLKIAELENGGEVVLFKRVLPATPEYTDTCKKILRDNIFRYDAPHKMGKHTFIWVTQSQEDPIYPIFTEMPAIIRPKLELADAVRTALSLKHKQS